MENVKVPVWLQFLLVHYGYGAVFLVLFVNNIGLPVPGTTLLLGAGLLVGTGSFSLLATVCVATTACFMGTNGGYWLGRRYGRPHLEKIRWLRLTHRRAQHLEHFFKRYGSKGVFFARFVALFHPVIGLLAGMGKTPVRPFLFFNLAGSAAYALLYTLAGDYFGGRWGFMNVLRIHAAFYILLLVVALIFLRLFWRHSVYTFFGHPFYKRKRGWF